MKKYIGVTKPLNIIATPSANLDAKYGAHDSIQDAIDAIPETLREIGLTVGIIINNKVVEYWWESGVSDSDLIVKTISSLSQLDNTDTNFIDEDSVNESINKETTRAIAAETKLNSEKLDASIYNSSYNNGVNKRTSVKTYNGTVDSLESVYGLEADVNGTNGKAKQNGWDVEVREDETKGGKSNRYNWNGEEWIDMNTGLYDESVARVYDVVLKEASDTSIPAFSAALSSRLNNKNLFFDALVGYFFTNTTDGKMYHLNNHNNETIKDYRGVLIHVSENTDYTLSGYYLTIGKVVTLLGKDLNVLDTRNLYKEYTGTAITIDADSWDNDADIHIRTPKDCTYIAINVATNNQPDYWKRAKIQLEEGTQKTDYVKGEGGIAGYINIDDARLFAEKERLMSISPVLDTPFSTRMVSKNMFSLSKVGDFFADTSRGQLYAPTAATISYKAVLIPIIENTDYTLSGYYLGVGKVVSLLDKNMNALDTRNLNLEYLGTAITIDAENWSDEADIHIRTFTECAYIVFNVATNNQPDYFLDSKIQFEKGTQKTDYVKGEGGLRGYLTLDDLSNIKKDSKWKGKKIIWFGTSIPATGYDQVAHSAKAYPAIVGKTLGANVINEAESSSQVRYAFVDGLEFDKEHQRLAFSLTKAEKKARGVDENYGYEQKMLSADRIDADLFVFDFGINDAHRDTVGFNIIPKKDASGKYNIEGLTDDYVLYEEGGVSQLLPADQNRKTFIGSMNFVLTRLFEKNPKAKVVLVTHHENQKDRDVNNVAIDGSIRNSKFNSSLVNEAIEEVAKYWSLSVIRLHDKLGWAQRVINGKTLYSYYAKDELHPNQDTTGIATNDIAKELVIGLEMV